MEIQGTKAFEVWQQGELQWWGQQWWEQQLWGQNLQVLDTRVTQELPASAVEAHNFQPGEKLRGLKNYSLVTPISKCIVNACS